MLLRRFSFASGAVVVTVAVVVVVVTVAVVVVVVTVAVVVPTGVDATGFAAGAVDLAGPAAGVGFLVLSTGFGKLTS